MTPNWQLVTTTRPDASDFPVTIVRSRSRDRAVWTSLVPVPLIEEHKAGVVPFFEHGEYVCAEDVYPPLA